MRGEHHIWMLIRGRKNLNLFRRYPIRVNGWQLLSTIYLPPWKKYLSGGFFMAAHVKAVMLI